MALVEDLEAIIQKAKTRREGIVETERDWEILVDLFKLWATYYPQESQDFRDTMMEIQSYNISGHGVVKGAGGGEMQHQLEVPFRWWKLVQVIYPKQKFDKKFTKKLSEHFPILKVAQTRL